MEAGIIVFPAMSKSYGRLDACVTSGTHLMAGASKGLGVCVEAAKGGTTGVPQLQLSLRPSLGGQHQGTATAAAGAAAKADEPALADLKLGQQVCTHLTVFWEIGSAAPFCLRLLSEVRLQSHPS